MIHEISTGSEEHIEVEELVKQRAESKENLSQKNMWRQTTAVIYG